MRVGLIGLGDIAQKAYLPVVANYPGITPVLCTRNPETLAYLKGKYRISETYTSTNSLIDSGIDAAMLHSNTESHPEIVETLLNKNIPVFVDKPLSYQIDDTERLLNLANQKNLTLFVGFNRRYAPLINAIHESDPTHIRLQKNRANLPAIPRVFILDDFIHVIDTLRHLSTGNSPITDWQDIQVNSYFRGDLLANIQVQWRSNNTLLTGSMNRICGVTEEQLEFFGQEQMWRIQSLSHGWHHRSQGKAELGFNDWQQTLYKRGFVDMVQAFIEQVTHNQIPDNQAEDILITHQLCEQVLNQITL